MCIIKTVRLKPGVMIGSMAAYWMFAIYTDETIKVLPWDFCNTCPRVMFIMVLLWVVWNDAI